VKPDRAFIPVMVGGPTMTMKRRCAIGVSLDYFEAFAEMSVMLGNACLAQADIHQLR
jgi:hypothetical protein